MIISLTIEGLDAPQAREIMDAGDLPAGVELGGLSLTGELGAERSSLIVSGVLSLALGVPSGVAANWVWQRIAPAEPNAVVTVVIEGDRCILRSAPELFLALEAAVQRKTAGDEAGTAGVAPSP
ncbi:hypothetical protein CNY89_04775 [Amaricoccus sp. HAR-UPW-R2A-40]|nr:hypothetical protein CNY89_04775 [Amaricoccus sp. HAR-UPW-R2A-40]